MSGRLVFDELQVSQNKYGIICWLLHCIQLVLNILRDGLYIEKLNVCGKIMKGKKSKESICASISAVKCWLMSWSLFCGAYVDCIWGRYWYYGYYDDAWSSNNEKAEEESWTYVGKKYIDSKKSITLK